MLIIMEDIWLTSLLKSVFIFLENFFKEIISYVFL